MTFDYTNLAIAVLFFFFGNISGYLLHDRMQKVFNMSEENSKNFLLVSVTLIWAASMIVDVISPVYDVPVAVHGLMGAIVGFFFYKPGNGKKNE